jgi:proline iminopeptidase
MTAIVNGVRLSYSDIGLGRPLLCLHGGMGVDANTLHVPGILDLSTHGVRVIIHDQRGHGQSERGHAADYSHMAWTTDARELATHLALDRFAMLGHSYGGFLALEYALRWPESLTHLVLVATSAGPVKASTTSFANDADLRGHFHGLWPRFFVHDDKHWSLFETLGFAADAYNAAFTRELPQYDVRQHVGRLSMPVLLLVGDRDAYRPHMEWLAEHLPDATLSVFDDVGHFPFVEAAGAFTTTVAAFLNAARDDGS